MSKTDDSSNPLALVMRTLTYLANIGIRPPLSTTAVVAHRSPAPSEADFCDALSKRLALRVIVRVFGVAPEDEGGNAALAPIRTMTRLKVPFNALFGGVHLCLVLRSRRRCTQRVALGGMSMGSKAYCDRRPGTYFNFEPPRRSILIALLGTQLEDGSGSRPCRHRPFISSRGPSPRLC